MNLSLFACYAMCFLLFLAAENGTAQKKGVDTVTVTYVDHVRLILSQNCYRCHGDDEPMGKLYLDTFEDIFVGGEHGPAVRPGKPDSSYMYLKLLVEPPFGKRMPARRNHPLAEVEIETIRQWILQGAVRGTDRPSGNSKE